MSRNSYLHEDRHSLTDKVLFGVALLGCAAYASHFFGGCELAKPKTDSNAVPSANMVYRDFDGDGDLDSAVRSKSGVLFEIKYDASGNPYLDRNAFAFEVDLSKPYHEQKQNALNARSR
ncbi:MAG: hypothetical protein QME12_05330 [Nanoarchaeota archaeon]|nr:hypothetical protein [Nanoarchaeota archaeon]